MMRSLNPSDSKIVSSEFYLKEAKSGHSVPVVGGVALHSIYNPIKEGEKFCEMNARTIQGSKRVLVLGFAFGYHVKAMLDSGLLENGAEVFVIDPNIEIAKRSSLFEQLNNRIQIICESDVNAIYAREDFLFFLLNQPQIVTHVPSFNLYQNFYKSFLGFTASAQIKSTLDMIVNPEVKVYLESLEEATLHDRLHKVKSEQIELQRMDHLLTAFGNIV